MSSKGYMMSGGQVISHTGVTPANKRTLKGGKNVPRKGGRGRKQVSLNAEEEERRQVRRERNKLAAARCRKRRVDHTNRLIDETDQLESKKKELQSEITKLNQQIDELQFLLSAHLPNCCQGKKPKRPNSLPMTADIKPNTNSILVTPSMLTTPSNGLVSFDWTLDLSTGLTPTTPQVIQNSSEKLLSPSKQKANRFEGETLTQLN